MSTPTGARVIARVLPEMNANTGPDTSLDSAARPTHRRDRNGAATRSSRLARAASSVMIALLTTMVVFAGFTGSPQSANAGLLDKAFKWACGISDKTPSARADNGLEALYGGRAPKFKSGEENTLTAYEDFGLMGMYWSEYDQDPDGCMRNSVNLLLAGEIFNISNLTTGVTIATFAWATDGDLLDSFTDPLNCVVAGCDGSKGLKDTLFLTYLLPVIVLGAVWAAWNGLFKKRTMHTTQGIVWMLCATTFSLIFLAQPGLIADKSNEVIGGITQNITNGVTGITSSTVAKDDPCYLPSGSKDRGNRIASCSMWKAMMWTPWVTGQFGTSAHEPIPGVEATIQGHSKPTDDIRLAQLDAQTNSGGDDADENTDQWEAVRDEVMNGNVDGVDANLWQGAEGGHRLTVALSSLIAAICLSALVIVISFATVVMSVGMILLITVAPIFLLVGVHPGVGRGIALKWLELLIGTMFKRIVLAAMLSILIGMYQVILAAPMPWLSQIALIIAMGVGVFVFRKPMLDTLNVVKLGGSSTGMEAGLQREVKQATGGTVGAMAGGFAGAQAGGLDAMVKGAVKGGIAGSRSGSPLRAASIGHGAGRRVGNRDAAADKAKDKAKDKTVAPGTTRPGTQDTAEREAQQARAQDQQWAQQQPSVDEILAGVETGSGAGGAVPRPDGAPSAVEPAQSEWERYQQHSNELRAAVRAQDEANDPALAALHDRLRAQNLQTVLPDSQEPQGDSAPQWVPRPVAATPTTPAPAAAAPMPRPPGAPAGLPTSAGVPTPVRPADNGNAAASRLPTAPPAVPGTGQREAAAPAPEQAAVTPQSATTSTPGSQSGQTGAAPTAPPRPQSSRPQSSGPQASGPEASL